MINRYKKQLEIYQEALEKEYSKEKIIVETSNLINSNISPVLLSLNKYNFKVESGLLKKYTVEVFDNEDISRQPLNTRCYNIKIKQKLLYPSGGCYEYYHCRRR